MSKLTKNQMLFALPVEMQIIATVIGACLLGGAIFAFADLMLTRLNEAAILMKAR